MQCDVNGVSQSGNKVGNKVVYTKERAAGSPVPAEKECNKVVAGANYKK
jgi:hypothetical protein